MFEHVEFSIFQPNTFSTSQRISAPWGPVWTCQPSTHLGKDRCRRIGPGKNRKSTWRGFRMQVRRRQDDSGRRIRILMYIEYIVVIFTNASTNAYPKTAGVIRTAGPNDLASPGAEPCLTCQAWHI